MSKTKNVLLNLNSSMKMIEKDSVDFWHGKVTFESKIKTLFDTSPLHCTNCQNSIIFLWLWWLVSKNLSLLKTRQPVHITIVKDTLTGDDKNMAKWRPPIGWEDMPTNTDAM